MESNFVSVFKLDGVPILPPLVNDEVRAAVAIYRQKAMEIENRLQEKRRASAVNNCVVSQSVDENNGATKDVEAVSTLNASNTAHSPTSESTAEAQACESVTITPVEVANDAGPIASLNVLERTSAVILPSPKLLPDEVWRGQQELGTLETKEKDEKDTSNCNSLSTQRLQSDPEQPSWQSPTRTVTPTSEEALPWFPLVRSNTFNLEKPSVDLMNLQRVGHSTPIDRPRDNPVVQSTDSPKQHRNPPDQSKSIEAARNALADRENTPVKSAIGASVVQGVNQSIGEQKKPDTDPAKGRPKRKTASRRISHSSAGSGRASERAFESVAQALTTHEQRMLELLKRQEEERLMLEQSFREKTQELVALCAKTLTIDEGNGMLAANGENHLSMSVSGTVRTKTPDLHTASSVSQLSLCDVSYDSCTDTDDAAYQTCQANGTSEENVNNNSELTLTGNQSCTNDAGRTIRSSVRRTANRTPDRNGNEEFSLLPQRMLELQQHRAATIINAYARGYLTRRLFKTDEVQSIKRTIADIVCFIISLQSEGTGRSRDTNLATAALRRDAGKHIASCLDRLHDIFVNFTTPERLQMIRRDRSLQRKPTLPKHRQLHSS
uniref:Uncharacterized protein n=1 Tax=Anopheles quadriannulatus TaxID=34691 RepID=A0A182WUZ2_ANOQN